MNTWTSLAEHELTLEHLDLLLDNKITAIRIKGFAAAQECRQFAEAAKKGRMQYYNVSDRIGFIGLAQYQYRWTKTKQEFLHDAQQARADVEAVFANSFDPLERFMRLLRSTWDRPVGLAHEEGQDYFAGIIRCTTQRIALHVDWAPVNSPGYIIDRIDGQLGWNFFAEELESGGQTTVHNAPWDPKMAPGDRPPPSFDLDRSLVEGAQSIVYQPTAGDVVIFNTRNPHEIAPGTVKPGGSRVSIGSFIGRMPDRELVLWA
jgi:hypothetical protein